MPTKDKSLPRYMAFVWPRSLLIGRVGKKVPFGDEGSSRRVWELGEGPQRTPSASVPLVCPPRVRRRCSPYVFSGSPEASDSTKAAPGFRPRPPLSSFIRQAPLLVSGAGEQVLLSPVHSIPKCFLIHMLVPGDRSSSPLL